jgi:hypothetical protein
LIKTLFILTGIISIILGTIGIFLPILPTVPFLILAAFCFGKSSDKLYNWLMNNKYLGKLIKDYHQKGYISKRAFFNASSTLWLSIIISLIFINNLAVRIMLVGIASLVTLYLFHIGPRKNK